MTLQGGPQEVAVAGTLKSFACIRLPKQTSNAATIQNDQLAVWFANLQHLGYDMDMTCNNFLFEGPVVLSVWNEWHEGKVPARETRYPLVSKRPWRIVYKSKCNGKNTSIRVYIIYIWISGGFHLQRIRYMKNTVGGPFIFCSHTMSVVALADGRSTRILSPAAGRSDDNHSVQSGTDVYQMYPNAPWCWNMLPKVGYMFYTTIYLG